MPALREVSVVLYVKPYIRKYLLAKLADEERLVFDDSARQLRDRLERAIQYPFLGLENDYLKYMDVPRSMVTMHILQFSNRQGDLGRNRRTRANAELNRAFAREMFTTTNYYRTRLRRSAREGLRTFRRHYAISEEDYPFDVCERLYYYQCQAAELRLSR